jgi:hypothetical protein
MIAVLSYPFPLVMTSGGALQRIGWPGLQVRGMIDASDAQTLVIELASGLAKKAYRL